MIVAKLSLPLSRHPPLGLHHLLRLVGTARALVALRRVEVLQVWARVATGPRVTEIGHRMVSGSTMAGYASGIYWYVSPWPIILDYQGGW